MGRFGAFSLAQLLLLACNAAKVGQQEKCGSLVTAIQSGARQDDLNSPFYRKARHISGGLIGILQRSGIKGVCDAGMIFDAGDIWVVTVDHCLKWDTVASIWLEQYVAEHDKYLTIEIKQPEVLAYAEAVAIESTRLKAQKSAALDWQSLEIKSSFDVRRQTLRSTCRDVALEAMVWPLGALGACFALEDLAVFRVTPLLPTVLEQTMLDTALRDRYLAIEQLTLARLQAAHLRALGALASCATAASSDCKLLPEDQAALAAPTARAELAAFLATNIYPTLSSILDGVQGASPQEKIEHLLGNYDQMKDLIATTHESYEAKESAVWQEVMGRPDPKSYGLLIATNTVVKDDSGTLRALNYMPYGTFNTLADLVPGGIY